MGRKQISASYFKSFKEAVGDKRAVGSKSERMRRNGENLTIVVVPYN